MLRDVYQWEMLLVGFAAMQRATGTLVHATSPQHASNKSAPETRCKYVRRCNVPQLYLSARHVCDCDVPLARLSVQRTDCTSVHAKQRTGITSTSFCATCWQRVCARWGSSVNATCRWHVYWCIAARKRLPVQLRIYKLEMPHVLVGATCPWYIWLCIDVPQEHLSMRHATGMSADANCH